MFNAEYSIAEEFSDEYSIADVLRKIVKILLRVESENLLDPPTLEVGPIDWPVRLFVRNEVLQNQTEYFRNWHIVKGFPDFLENLEKFGIFFVCILDLHFRLNSQS